MKASKIILGLIMLWGICAVIADLAARGQTPTKKAAPKAQKKAAPARPEPDPEDRWICRIGSYHDCHCPAMVAEQQEEAYRNGTQPKGGCDIIQQADTKHPEHTCKRTCKAIAGCQCWDGPVCRGPVVYNPGDDNPEAQQ